MSEQRETRDSVRSLWPWALFALLVCAGIVLFFFHVPR